MQKIISLLEEIRDVSKANRETYAEAMKRAQRQQKVLTPVLIIVVATWFYFVAVYFLG